VADAGPDQTVFEGEVVQLDGSGSISPTGAPLNYLWEIIADGTVTLSDSSVVNPTLVPDMAGVYKIKLTVFSAGWSSIPDTVIVSGEAVQIENVIDRVEDLVSEGELNQGQGNALISKLEGATSKLPEEGLRATTKRGPSRKGKRPNIKAAINKFEAFIHQVNSLIDEGVLSARKGQPLIYAVSVIIAELGEGAAKLAAVPTEFSLSQAYPNPANPSTMIHYILPEAVDARLTIFNIQGQPVRVLVDAFQRWGEHHVEWNGRDDNGRVVAAGVYLYRLEAGHHMAVRKMILAK